MSSFIDLTGQKFERLTVIQRAGNDKWGQSRWLCKCSCEDENEVIVRSAALKNNHTKSCGCLLKEITRKRSIKHGHTQNGKRTKTHESWHGIIKRCTNPNSKQYKDYGDRGITVCERWMKFENFLEDMGECPPRYTIERKDNDKGYYKENCVWATRKQQARNTRRNRLITYKGKTQCLAIWAEETEISEGTILIRLKRGWSIEKVLTTPVKKRRK